jgi:hypothetical protein
MTVEIKEKFTIKVKRTDHPNAGKYPGRPSQEFGFAYTNFLGSLDSEDVNDCLNGTLVYEEELSAQFFDSIVEGDIVGVGLPLGLEGKPAAYKFKILSVDKEADTMQARNVTWESEKHPEYVGEETALTFENLSCALGIGFGEILMRDGKPFGVSEEIEMTVNIVGEASGSVSGSSGSAPGNTP